MTIDKAQKILNDLSALADWCKEHPPAEFAALVAKMTPEERVRVLAHVHVLRDNLAELQRELPPEGR